MNAILIFFTKLMDDVHELNEIPSRWFKFKGIKPSEQTEDNANWIRENTEKWYCASSPTLLGDVLIILKIEDVIINVSIGKTKGCVESYDSENILIESMTCYDKKMMELLFFLKNILQCA